ncbi:MAG: hypothetical protein M3Y72_09460, partial [Acidobacteriota bacterium]|nr:hypothetical protein [Acidobacteriota bacterium]
MEAARKHNRQNLRSVICPREHAGFLYDIYYLMRRLQKNLVCGATVKAKPVPALKRFLPAYSVAVYLF